MTFSPRSNPKHWRIGGGQVFTLDRTYIMGILNVTPDSFSDGGQFDAADAAIARALEMEAQGADIIDIGGQSTRPGHTPVSAQEEWRRIAPVLAGLRGRLTVPVSVDTYLPEVAERAVAAGAAILNDVTGFRDPTMRRIAAASGAGCVIMHDLTLDENADVCAELGEFFRERVNQCLADGIAPDAICLDPGVGFGKSYEQNLAIAAHFERLCDSEYPLLAAASRKRVIGMSCGNPPAPQRVSGTVAYHTACVLGGANLLRVHDVPEAKQAAQVADAILSQK